MRVESTITESNGSSSMASVCGGCLAMLDAGVPLIEPVAGIAMGLILEPDGRFQVGGCAVHTRVQLGSVWGFSTHVHTWLGPIWGLAHMCTHSGVS